MVKALAFQPVGRWFEFHHTPIFFLFYISKMHIEIVRASISIQFDTADSIEISMYRPNLNCDVCGCNQGVRTPWCNHGFSFKNPWCNRAFNYTLSPIINWYTDPCGILLPVVVSSYTAIVCTQHHYKILNPKNGHVPHVMCLAPKNHKSGYYY